MLTELWSTLTTSRAYEGNDPLLPAHLNAQDAPSCQGYSNYGKITGGIEYMYLLDRSRYFQLSNFLRRKD
jgi:hypothetical protein